MYDVVFYEVWASLLSSSRIVHVYIKSVLIGVANMLFAADKEQH